MFKSTIIAIILFMMSLSAGAATPSVLTQADFIQLSSAQKDEYIIKLMELTVELEDRYYKETAKYGYSQDRFEKYTKILRTLKSVFLIDSAYALQIPNLLRDKDSSWHQLAVNFNTLMKNQRSTDGKTKDDNCIFAGWVSRVRYIEKDGKTVATCAHPDFITGTEADRFKNAMAPESKGYPDPEKNSNCPLNDKKWIQCNPVIFGYKNEEKKSLFCVVASDGAHNSSYNCMQHALNDPEVPGSVDSKETRLKNLRNRLADKKNAGVFQDVWEFTYKTCLCPKVIPGSKFSQDYQDYMRPHRTCYGLMEMMSSTALECTATDVSPFPSTDTALFKELKSQINRNEFKTKKDASESEEQYADKAYKGFLNTLTTKNNPDYLRLCNLQPNEIPEVKKDYKCSAECTPDAADAKKVTCKYSISADGKPADLEKDAEGPQPKDGEKQVSVKFKPKGAKEENISCDIPEKVVPKDTPKVITCSADCKTNADNKVECTYKLSDGTPNEVKTASLNGPTEVKAEDNDKNVDVKYVLDGKDSEITVACKVKVAPKDPPKTEDNKSLVCTGECKNETKDGKPSLSCSYTFKDGDKIVNPKFDQPTVKAGDKSVKIEYTLEGSTDKKNADCSLTMPQEDKPKPTPSRPMNYQNGLPQMPQPQIRGTSDTSAIGIK